MFTIDLDFVDCTNVENEKKMTAAKGPGQDGIVDSSKCLALRSTGFQIKKNKTADSIDSKSIGVSSTLTELIEFPKLKEGTDMTNIELEPLFDEHFPWYFSETDSISGMELDIIRKRQSNMITNFEYPENDFSSGAKKQRKFA